MMDYNLPTVSILGCGWLGLPLAKSLVQLGYSVKGSTTSENKLPELTAENIQPYLLQIMDGKLSGNINEFLESHVLIINIPPKLRGSIFESYPDKIQLLVDPIRCSKVRRVIFISSTSVYPDQSKVFSEDDTFLPDTAAGEQLLAAEKILLDAEGFDTAVIRFGGLVGPMRHPVKHLAGRDNLSKPKAAVNLIDLQDCIEMICLLVKTCPPGKIFNGVAPSHPDRKTYYMQKAIEFKLPIPTFDDSDSEIGKIISGSKIEAMGFTYSKPNP